MTQSDPKSNPTLSTIAIQFNKDEKVHIIL